MNWIVMSVAIAGALGSVENTFAQSCFGGGTLWLKGPVPYPSSSTLCPSRYGVGGAHQGITVSASAMATRGRASVSCNGRNGGVSGDPGTCTAAASATFTEDCTVVRLDGKTGPIWVRPRRPVFSGNTFLGTVPGQPLGVSNVTGGLQVRAGVIIWAGGFASSIGGYFDHRYQPPNITRSYTEDDSQFIPQMEAVNNWLRIQFRANVGSCAVGTGAFGDQLTMFGQISVSWAGLDFVSDRWAPQGEAEVPCAVIGTQTGFDYAKAVKLCPADLTVDDLVDDADFVHFVAAYDSLGCLEPAMSAGCPADFNLDGYVDDDDFVVFASAYNELLCP